MNMKKKLLLTLLTLTILQAGNINAIANNDQPEITNEPAITTDAPAVEIEEATPETDTSPPASESILATVPEAKPPEDPLQASDEIMLALETDLMIKNGAVSRTWARPFLYHGTTYAPLNIIADALAAEMWIDESENMVKAAKGWHTFAISLDSEDLKVYGDIMFVPLRSMCTDLGCFVFWDSGLISISSEEKQYTPEQVAELKQKLNYVGYNDKYYVPKNIVNPYVTYTYDQMLEDVDYLANAYPELIKPYSLGKSSEGREIIAFDLGKGSKKVVMCAAMHAREHIVTNFIMYMADSYALGYENSETRDNYNIRALLDNVTLTIIPMVNPDGINLVQHGYESTKDPEYVSGMKTNSYGYKGWKANINGVDLNNNFDYLWHPKGSQPSYAGYGGPYAASEAETQVMRKFIDETDFDIFASLHTQGQVVYWMDPNCDQSLKTKFKPLVDRICYETGFTEMPSDGTIGLSGYMTDYIRGCKQKMAMTIELCPYIGPYPYPESDFDKVAYPVRNLGLILADICLNNL